MDVYFRNRKLAKLFSSERELKRRWGLEMARIIMRRVAELEYAPSLGVAFTIPGARCHQLKGSRAGQLAVNLRHPYRLVFRPAEDPIPVKDDGGIDLDKVTKVEILEVVDYHG